MSDIDQTLTVGELGAAIRMAMEGVFPYGVWVEGEISDLSRSRNGHVYFDLVEPSDRPGAAPVATVPVVLFRDNRDRVNRLLKRHGDPIRMTDGVQIRIQGMVDFYPPTGRLQLRMSAIDPTYTLGRLAADRDALLAALSAEDLLRANGRRALPAVPLRLGVVTSLGSAAHADITTVFDRSGFAFTLVEVDSAVQGAGAERAVAAAIMAACDADVDLVLVVRGGGSRTDLATFDHELVARAIAGAPVPVVTGIGHEVDRSVADEVAHTAHTTPTAAAQSVVERVDSWLGRLRENEAFLVARGRRAADAAEHRVNVLRRHLAGAAGTAIAGADDRLDGASLRIELAGRHALRAADLRIDRVGDVVRRRAPRHLTDAERRVGAAAARTRALDPAIALARGWSITRDADGRVLRSIDDVAPGDTVFTQVADGTLTSTIDP